jgi:hypothetical protein
MNRTHDELSLTELESELVAELPARPLMKRHRFSQHVSNNINNSSSQAATVSGNGNTVNQTQVTINVIESNVAGSQQN